MANLRIILLFISIGAASLLGFQNCSGGNSDFSQKSSQASREDSSSISATQNQNCPEVRIPLCSAGKILKTVVSSDGCESKYCSDDSSDNENVCPLVTPAQCQAGEVAVNIMNSNNCPEEICIVDDAEEEDSNPNGSTNPGQEEGNTTPADPEPSPEPDEGDNSNPVNTAQSCSKNYSGSVLEAAPGEVVRDHRIEGPDVYRSNPSKGTFGLGGFYCYEAELDCPAEGSAGESSLKVREVYLDTDKFSVGSPPSASDCSQVFNSHRDFIDEWSAQNTYSNFVAIYQQHLYRNPDKKGMQYYYYQMMLSGLSLDAALRDIENSNEAWVTNNCYMKLLNRKPSETEVSYWVDHIEGRRSPRLTRSQVCYYIQIQNQNQQGGGR